ncbi:Spy/CpxP family protein refolding chaperone [Ancylobacter polymorphus]|uniref:LTXXQ motif family protein n=1 Tax=Ancylobacter polymorphus TaxID=223390 RepID=A0ABU0BGC1_9HYPH|nr:Spy/CpxP family protein refolding chaperone [Ancylobacter polymorphus]MDQ0304893.1 hypothetical protein [Ancylobacter polymorphus]
MTKFRKLMTTAALGAALIASASVRAEDAHHPPGASSPVPQSDAPMAAPQPPAAPPAPDSPQGMMGPGMMGGASPMGMMGQMMAPARIQGRIAFLRTEIGITTTQQPLWDAFADALRANARSMAGMMSAMQDQMMSGQAASAPTLPQRIEAYERMLAGRLEALRKMKAALDPLYAALDDAQRRAADQLLMPMPMMGLM